MPHKQKNNFKENVKKLHDIDILDKVKHEIEQKASLTKSKADLLFHYINPPHYCAFFIQVLNRLAAINQLCIKRVSKHTFQDETIEASKLAQKIIETNVFSELVKHYPILDINCWVTEIQRLKLASRRQDKDKPISEHEIIERAHTVFHGEFRQNLSYIVLFYPFLEYKKAHNIDPGFLDSLMRFEEQHILIVGLMLDLHLYFKKHPKKAPASFYTKSLALRSIKHREYFETYDFIDTRSIKAIHTQLVNNLTHPDDRKHIGSIANYLEAYLKRSTPTQSQLPPSKNKNPNKKKTEEPIGWGRYLNQIILENEAIQEEKISIEDHCTTQYTKLYLTDTVIML